MEDSAPRVSFVAQAAQRALAPYSAAAAPVTALLAAAPLAIPLLAALGTIAAARLLAPAPAPSAAAARAPFVSATDWRAYLARGAWLPLSWALAALFLLGAHAAAPALWRALPALLGTDDPMALFVASVMLPNTGLTLLGNLFFGALYYLRLPSVEARRIGGARRRPWPWSAEATPVARAAFWRLLPRSVLRVALNHATLVPTLALQHLLFAWLGFFETSPGKLPSLPEFLLQLAACVLVEDVVFYHVHRLLHVSWIYPHVHKIHHEWHTPIALASEHAHHLEFAFGNGMPVILGPMLTRCHCFTFAVWVLIRIATSLDNHCGYSFALSPVRLLPFGTTAAGHDHHHSKNDGMLASQFTLFDVLYRSLGTFPEAKRLALLASDAEGKGSGPKVVAAAVAAEEVMETGDPTVAGAAAVGGGAGSRRRAASRGAPAARASRG